MRMLEQVSNVVAYLSGIRRAGQHEKYDAEIELAYMQYVGLSGQVLEMMAAEDIIALLNISGQDWLQVGIVAQLMREEAAEYEARGETEAAQNKAEKAALLLGRARPFLEADGYMKNGEFLARETF
jgi:hypothetical protein